MRKHKTSNNSSLDMLLDTMCNTFGGVCFIALMIAIISASLPSEQNDEQNEMQVSEQMIANKETARLKREREELKSAIEIQKSFVTSNATSGASMLSSLQLVTAISSNATEVTKLENEKRELEDKLAKLTTDVSYNTREALRLERLLKEMEERLGKPGNMKNRAVRTPVERELMGYRALTVWIRQGRMYCLFNKEHVDCDVKIGDEGKEWYYVTRPASGYRLDEYFFRSSEYSRLMSLVSGKVYIRIVSDSSSFGVLCDLRDDLIRRRKMYNWYWDDESVLVFKEGYDGKVQ